MVTTWGLIGGRAERRRDTGVYPVPPPPGRGIGHFRISRHGAHLLLP
jgi:hypothetical protein